MITMRFLVTSRAESDPPAGSADAGSEQAGPSSSGSPDDSEPIADFRYDTHMRVLMVNYMVKHLSVADQVAIQFNRIKWIKTGRNWKAKKEELHALVMAEYERRHIEEGQPRARPRSVEAVASAAREFTKRHLRGGNVFPAKPHEVGYKVEKNMEYLREIRDLILRGHKCTNGGIRMYKDLLEVKRLAGAAFQGPFDKLGISIGTLWQQLQQAFPELGKFRVKYKKVRSPLPVQVCKPQLSHFCLVAHPETWCWHCCVLH